MKKILALLALAAALLPSCRKADWESAEGKVTVTNPDPPVRRAEFITFNATLEPEYRTRTSVDLDITQKLTWEKGDQVLVEDENGKTAVYAASNGGSQTTTLTRVSGDTLAVSGTYKAWYPVSYKEEGAAAAIYFDEPKTLKGGPMVAEGMRTLEFKNVCGIVRCSYNPASNFLAKKIRMAAQEPVCAGDTLVCDLTRKSPAGMSVYSTGKNIFSFFIPAGTYTDLNVRFVADDNVLADITLEYELTVPRSGIVNVDLNTPQGRQNNLSKYEKANCYVISSVGEYYFTASKGVSGQPVEGMASVDILWETDNSPAEPDRSIFKTLSLEGNKVMFETPDPFVPGNAVLAARNEAGDILWSWHIWAVETPPGVQQYDSAGKFLLMDRSLGSLAAPTLSKPANDKYASLLYQWGRKDPFPGYCTQGDRDQMDPSGRKMSVAEGPASLAEATANPTVFYTGTATWTSEASAGLWSSVAKTDQDPCPPGYMVPPMTPFSEEAGIFLPSYKGSTCVSSGGAYVFQYPAGNYYGYPLSSILTGETGTKGNKSDNYIWTTGLGEGTVLSCSMSYGIPEGSTAKHPLVTLNDPRPLSDGISVRCMRILEEQ